MILQSLFKISKKMPVLILFFSMMVPVIFVTFVRSNVKCVQIFFICTKLVLFAAMIRLKIFFSDPILFGLKVLLSVNFTFTSFVRFRASNTRFINIILWQTLIVIKPVVKSLWSLEFYRIVRTFLEEITVSRFDFNSRSSSI